MANPNLGGFLSGISNLAGVSAAARNLVGNQPMQNALSAVAAQNALSAAAAPPAAAAPARVVAAQQPHHDEQNVEQPEPPIPLDTLQKLQAYLNSCPPGLTELNLDGCRINSLAGVIFPNGLLDLDLGDNQITSLTGVNFPDGLTKLSLFGNQITSFKGVRFPHSLLELNLDGNQITSLRGLQFPPGLLVLSITDTKINSLAGFQFPPSLLELYLHDNEINSLQGVQFPPRLTLLNLENNKIKSLQGVHFPIGLLRLTLSFNEIASLTGVQFPPSLTELRLENNQISPLNRWGSPFEGVIFPPRLLVLNLSNNNLQTLNRLQFPPNLTSLNLEGNPLRSLIGIINPNEYVMEYLKHNFTSVYFRDLHAQHKGAKMAETSALKAARQSQKATLKKMSDLSQQSVQNQLKAVTSFLREGMTARAMEHDESVKQKKSDIFVRLADGALYHVPYAKEMTVQNVLDYLNEHYYISVLNPNHGVVRLIFEGVELDPSRTLVSYNVVNESTLYAKPKYIGQGGGKRRIATHKRYKQQRDKTKSKKRTHK